MHFPIVAEDDDAEEEKVFIKSPSAKSSKQESANTPVKHYWSVRDLQTLLECLEAGLEKVEESLCRRSLNNDAN